MTDWTTISAIISDLDGVTYRGADPIPEAVTAFRAWHDRGLPYAFVTNNSTKSAETFAATLTAMGIPAEASQIVTSSAAAAARLKALLPQGARVLVIGAPALAEAVAARGFTLAETEVQAVVAGLDREFTFRKLELAQRALLGGALFLGTNPDRMLPHGAGFEPGAGSILAAIETASGVGPTIIGKPQPDLVRTALERLGTPAETTFMLGDQVETDIAAGQAAGLPTILVRTGVPPRDVAGVHPTHDIRTLAEIPDHILAPKGFAHG